MQNRCVCVIDNYNYAKYLAPCLDSALAQTRAFDLIIVVDDGSVDDSRPIIERYARDHGNLIAVYKPNGGQLSCFNAARDQVENGDLVFFLDADDLYPANYVEEFVKAAAIERADFYFCNAVKFTEPQDCPADARVSDDPAVVLPLTSALTLASQRWVGSPTSALVVSGNLYRNILPYPFERDWVVRADDVLVFGSAILGARKVFIRSLGVGYRIHGSNLFDGEKKWSSKEELLLREFRLERLFTIYSGRAGVARHPPYAAVAREMQLLDQGVKRLLGLPSTFKMLRRDTKSRIRQFFRVLFS